MNVRKLKTLARLMIAVAAMTPLLATTPAGAQGWWLTYWGDYGTNELSRRVMTPDGGDTYGIVKTINPANNVGSVTMSAPVTNTGGNSREIFWPADARDYLNSQSCAAWVSSSNESVQEGLALRIVDTPTSTRAITVTKNVIYGIYSVFNVHVWDTANTQQPFKQVAQFKDMEGVMRTNGVLKAKPWRACAQVEGETLRFKIWFPFQGQAEPSWTDPVYSRSATVPAEWSQPGKTGWYIGHLRAGEQARYNGLTTFALL